MEIYLSNDSAHDPPLELISKPLRWRVLQYLMQSSTDQASLDELVDCLVEDTATGCTTEPERIRVRLHHCDLPKLVDYSVIDYDPRTGDVRYLPDDRIVAAMKSLEGD